MLSTCDINIDSKQPTLMGRVTRISLAKYHSFWLTSLADDIRHEHLPRSSGSVEIEFVSVWHHESG